MLIAISDNSDIGDAWDYADDPTYPVPFADLAIRLGVNSIVYAMTHWSFGAREKWTRFAFQE